MSTTWSFGAAQSRLLSILDDAVSKAVANGKNAVVLTGATEDMVVLGLMSLYHTDPIRSYAVSTDRKARTAAMRFGALHQTISPQAAAAADSLPMLVALAKKDGVTAMTGHDQPLLPTPFDDRAVQGFWRELPASVDRADLVRAAFWPLLGKKLGERAAAR